MRIIIHHHIYIPSSDNSSIKLFIQNRAVRTDNITLSFQVCTKAKFKTEMYDYNTRT